MKKFIVAAVIAFSVIACSKEKSIKEYTVEEVSANKALAERLETELTSQEYNDYIEGAMNYIYDKEKVKKMTIKQLIAEGKK